MFVTSWGSILAWSASCGDIGTGGGNGGGAGGGGGSGGAPGCPEEIAPLFTLRLAQQEGQFPEDLELQVSWSAGDEPLVTLGDPSSYGTSADNVVCVRKRAGDPASTSATATGTAGSGGGYDAGGGSPSSTTGGPSSTSGGEGGAAPSDELVCELWTSGPTRVRLDATGFVPFDETLPPATSDSCERPVPSEVDVELVVEEPEEAAE